MGETEHICDPNLVESISRVRLKKLINGHRRLNDQFKCGGCHSTFTTICSLHAHCGKHNEGGSYYFDCLTSTAFPRYDTACVWTQVTAEDLATEVQTLNQEEQQRSGEIMQSSAPSVRTSKRIAQRLQQDSRKTVSEQVYDIGVGSYYASNKIEDIKHTCTVKDDGTEDENTRSNKLSPRSFGSRSTDVHNVSNSNNRNYSEISQGKKHFPRKRKSQNLDPETHKKDKIDNSIAKSTNKSNKRIKTQSSDCQVHSNSCQKFTGNENSAVTDCVSDSMDNNKKDRVEADTHEKDELTASEMLLAISKGDNTDLSTSDRDNGTQYSINITTGENKMIDASSGTENGMYADGDIPSKSNRQSFKKGSNRRQSENTKEELECKTCGRRGSSGMIAYHKYLHMDRKSFACEICGQLFQIPRSLAIHKRQHEEKQFRCEFCPAAFHRKQYLDTHLLKHSGENPFMCDLCGKAYRDRSHLKRHIKHVHDRKRDFECDICQEKFFRSDHLKNHRLRHFEADKQCQFCQRKFKHSEDLIRHTRTHTGEKNWYCHICGHGFVAVAPYYTHMAKKHNMSRDEAKIWKSKSRELHKHSYHKQTGSVIHTPAVSDTGEDTDHSRYSTVPANKSKQEFSNKVHVLPEKKTSSVKTSEASTYVDLPDTDGPERQETIENQFTESTLLIKYASASDDSKGFTEEDIYSLQGSAVNDLMAGSEVTVGSTVAGSVVAESQNGEEMELNTENDFNVIIAVNSLDFDGETVMFIDGDQCQSEVVIDN